MHIYDESIIYSMRMHQNVPFFMNKNGKKWLFFVQRLSFF